MRSGSEERGPAAARSRRGAVAGGLALALCAAGAGCSEAGGLRDEPPGPEAAGPEAAVPAGAVPIGSGFYMVPMGEDADGCQRFRLHSPTRYTNPVVYYRTADGSFVLEKARAACKAGG